MAKSLHMSDDVLVSLEEQIFLELDRAESRDSVGRMEGEIDDEAG